MDIVLPYKTVNKAEFIQEIDKIGFQSFELQKFIYVLDKSDLDVYPLIGSTRINILLYSWQLVVKYSENGEVECVSKDILKRLLHYTLELWFGVEWDSCSLEKKVALLYCIEEAQMHLKQEFPHFDWTYMLQLGMDPWKITFFDDLDPRLKNINEILKSSVTEVTVPVKCNEMDHILLNSESPQFILLRIIKLYDAGYKDVAANVCLSVISAWNYQKKTSEREFEPTTRTEQENCMVMIFHVFLMIIFDLDYKGQEIDKLVQDLYSYIAILPTLDDDALVNDLEETVAGCIARACINAGLVTFQDFVMVIHGMEDFKQTTLFGVLFMVYRSYIIGFLLQEKIKLIDPKEVEVHLDDFKKLMSAYVKERERSEIILQYEQHKQQKQTTSHNMPHVILNMSPHVDCVAAVKRDSNGTVILSDDSLATDSLSRQNTIFYNLPDSSNLIDYTYEQLAKNKHSGWNKVKVILLVHIIGDKLKEIEGWRYHPGLTVDFMQGLETSLSRYFEDLAKSFHEHQFMEQEFWLTAFYLDPNERYFSAIQRCAARGHRRQNIDENNGQDRPSRSRDKTSSATNAKFALLSSTIEVNEILHIANHENPSNDYDELYKMLKQLGFEDKIVKDLVSITFQLRNKSFSWALNWQELRKRCRHLLENPIEKQRLVELNMAEANDRLQFLHIDYQKYRNRPQMDYGCIERGYEGAAMIDFDADSEEDDEYDDPFEDDEDDDFQQRTVRERKEDKSRRVDRLITIVDECPDLTTVFNESSTRLTRSRVAAVKSSIREEVKRRRIDADSSSLIEEQTTDAVQQSENTPLEAAQNSDEQTEQNSLTFPSSNCGIYSQDYITDFDNIANEEQITKDGTAGTGFIFDKFSKWVGLNNSVECDCSKVQTTEEAAKIEETCNDFYNTQRSIANSVSKVNSHPIDTITDDALDYMSEIDEAASISAKCKATKSCYDPTFLLSKFSNLLEINENIGLNVLDVGMNVSESSIESNEFDVEQATHDEAITEADSVQRELTSENDNEEQASSVVAVPEIPASIATINQEQNDNSDSVSVQRSLIDVDEVLTHDDVQQQTSFDAAKPATFSACQPNSVQHAKAANKHKLESSNTLADSNDIIPIKKVKALSSADSQENDSSRRSTSDDTAVATSSLPARTEADSSPPFKTTSTDDLSHVSADTTPNMFALTEDESSMLTDDEEQNHEAANAATAASSYSKPNAATDDSTYGDNNHDITSSTTDEDYNDARSVIRNYDSDEETDNKESNAKNVQPAENSSTQVSEVSTTIQEIRTRNNQTQESINDDKGNVSSCSSTTRRKSSILTLSLKAIFEKAKMPFSRGKPMDKITPTTAAQARQIDLENTATASAKQTKFTSDDDDNAASSSRKHIMKREPQLIQAEDKTNSIKKRNKHSRLQETTEASGSSETVTKQSTDPSQCKPCVVRVKRLTVDDIKVLRQPIVRLKRVNTEQLNCRSKDATASANDAHSSSRNRKCGKQISKVLVKTRITPARLAAVKNTIDLYSESSTESESYRPKRKIKRPNRYSPTRKSSPKKMIVTPRSASGLKFRISSMRDPVLDYIEISSSDDNEAAINQLSTVNQLPIQKLHVDVTHPLYEEEVTLFPLGLKK